MLHPNGDVFIIIMKWNLNCIFFNITELKKERKSIQNCTKNRINTNCVCG